MSSNIEPIKTKTKKVSYFVLYKLEIYKLLLYAFLAYLSIAGINLYSDLENTFINLFDILDSNVILDVYTPFAWENCSTGYVEPEKKFITGTKSGCVCDNQVMNEQDCNLLTVYADKPCLSGVNNSTISGKYGQANSNTGSIFGSITQKDLISYSDCKNSPFCCFTCYQPLNATNPATTNTLFDVFYDYRKICILYSTNQSTKTYIDTINYDTCDTENICNVYFCKLDNNKDNTCPLIYFSYGAGNNTLVFSDNYLTFDDFNNNGLPLLHVPIINITVGREDACVDYKTSFQSNYPLCEVDTCIHSDSYYEIISKDLISIIDSNNMTDYFQTNYPFYENYMHNDTWTLQLQTAVDRIFLYCLLENFSYNINPNSTSSIENNKHFLLQNLNVLINLRWTATIAKRFQLGFVSLTLILLIYQIVIIILKISNFIHQYQLQLLAQSQTLNSNLNTKRESIKKSIFELNEGMIDKGKKKRINRK